MKPTYLLLVSLGLAYAALPVAAFAEGKLGTLDHGRYTCGTPGVATGPVVNVIPDLSFTILGGSSYASEKGGGTYLLTGDLLTFTRGPLKDLKFERDKTGLWREIDKSGAKGDVRCSRVG